MNFDKNHIGSPGGFFPGWTRRVLLVGLFFLLEVLAGQCHVGTANASVDGATSGGAALESMPSGGRSNAPQGVYVDLRMHLPFPCGKTYEVIQGNNGTYTHDGFNRYAWDFGMPEGSPVCAAAGGQVVQVKQDSTRGGPSAEYLNDGNNVIVDHGAGVFTLYMHLEAHSVLVREGDMVRAGQVIAHSGNTGFSSMPHLHFQVQNELGQSLPARFLNVPGGGVPVTGIRITSANDGRGTSPYLGVSRFDGSVFERNGIFALKSNIPAHLLSVRRKYVFSGRLRRGGGEVAVYLMEPTGGEAIATALGSVARDGSFSISIDFADLPARLPGWSKSLSQSNRFCLAVAPVISDGSFWSDVSIPVCIR